MRLNLGCSDRHISGFWNVDRVPPADQIVDLEQEWPWEESTVEEIRAHDVIEHLRDKIHTMNELWRVLQPGGRVEIIVPTTDGSGAFQDPTHVTFWHPRSFLYYEADNPYRERFALAYGVMAKFKIIAQAVTPTVDGPKLRIVLQAVKP